MSDDLVKRLRVTRATLQMWSGQLLIEQYEKERTEAADRIERLETALREIAWIATPDHEEARHKATEIARKALEGKDEQ
jgi:hypothetical protein